MNKKNQSLGNAGAGKPLDLCIGAYKRMLGSESEHSGTSAGAENANFGAKNAKHLGAYGQWLKREKASGRDMGVERDKKRKQISSKLHIMEREMRCLDFSFLDVEKMDNQLENESLCLFIGFLKGE